MIESKIELPVHIDTELCKGCNICVVVCPQDVLELSEDMNSKGYNIASVERPSDCIQCMQCEIKCPDLAIKVDK